MKIGSLFAGIDGFGLAARNVGIDCAWSAEIDPQAQSVLRRHFGSNADWNLFKDVHDVGSRTAVRPEILCGGFPCQDISVAGKRAGLAGKRSGLWWEFARCIAEFQPQWVVAENVAGLLSSNGFRDLGTILKTLGNLGYGYAYRVLDSQWFGVPQRRRRVFIVGCAGADVRRAAEVLFERESLPWDSPPSRETRARVAACLTSGVATGSGVNRPGRRREDDFNIVNALDAQRGGPDDNAAQAGHLVAFRTSPNCGAWETGDRIDSLTTGTDRTSHVVAPALTGNPYGDHESREGLLVPVAFAQNQRDEVRDLRGVAGSLAAEPGMKQQTYLAYQCHGSNVGPMGTLRAGNVNDTGGVPFTLAVQERGRPEGRTVETQAELAYSLMSPKDGGRSHENNIAGTCGVRRLTPKECERLQSFPDGWTEFGHDNKRMSDSARYRMLGNAVTVNVVQWIIGRIKGTRT